MSARNTDWDRGDGPEDRWLNAEQAARYSGYSSWSIRRFATQRLIRHSKAGKAGQYRFKREWIDEFLLSRTIEPKTIVIPPPRNQSVQAGSVKSVLQRVLEIRKEMDEPEKDRRAN